MKHHRRKGFTLVELLAVMLILSILMALVVGVSGNVTARVNRKRTIVTMDIVLDAIQAYREDQGSDPNSLLDLVGNAVAQKVLANLDSETWANKDDPTTKYYDERQNINDAYGTPLKYEKTGGLGGCPVLISGGPDHNADTDDDLRSDKRK